MHAEYYCPILTAFHEDGTFDKEKQHILYDRLLEAGIDGVVVLGSSGEFYALTYDKCCTVGQDAIAYISGRIPVYVGTGRMSATETIALSSEMIDAWGYRCYCCWTVLYFCLNRWHQGIL